MPIGQPTDLIEVLADIASVQADTTHISSHVHHARGYTGTIYYVDATQSDDTGNGLSPDTAKKTIGAAITAASAGDAIAIRAGTYAENVVMNKAAMELWPEMGVVIDGDGTCLTVSAANCKIGTSEGNLVLTPAEDQTGVAVTAGGAGSFFVRAMSIGTLAACGFDVDATGIEMQWCRATGIKAGGKAFDIGAAQIKLYDCSTVGSAATTGFYIGGGTYAKGLLVNCTSAGHSVAGYSLGAGVSGVTLLHCSSGAGDGKWVDTDNANVWSEFTYDDTVYKLTTFTSPATTFNIFKITGAVRVKNIHGHVETAIPNTTSTIHLELYSTGGTIDITDSPGVDIDQAAAGALLVRNGPSDVALSLADPNGTPAVAENTAWKDPSTAIDVVEDDNALTYIRLVLSATLASGAIHWHCEWEPLTNDGFVEAA